MDLGTFVTDEDPSVLLDGTDQYFCPVCGVELSFSNFVTDESDYYCPYCSTRQTPVRV